jgi:hypothetical protein
LRGDRGIVADVPAQGLKEGVYQGLADVGFLHAWGAKRFAVLGVVVAQAGNFTPALLKGPAHGEVLSLSKGGRQAGPSGLPAPGAAPAFAEAAAGKSAVALFLGFRDMDGRLLRFTPFGKLRTSPAVDSTRGPFAVFHAADTRAYSAGAWLPGAWGFVRVNSARRLTAS